MEDALPDGYDQVIQECRELFVAKLGDYGPSWVVMRLMSIVDQIYIKASRIRSLERADHQQRVSDTPRQEYLGIVNYSVIALDKLMSGRSDDLEPLPVATGWQPPDTARATYESIVDTARTVMRAKDHDYGEAWRGMEIASLTDEILGRVYRIKRLAGSPTGPTASEGVESQFVDTLNYAVLAVIKMRDSAR